MIDWYIEIADFAPDGFRNDDYISKVIDTASPFMDYFCKRLSEIEDWKLEDALVIFKDIIEEMPIMSCDCHGDDEFYINYNRYTFIKLTDTTKQIYREIKLEKLLKNK
jgi:hypothetical protein